ncbi:LysE family translocator [Psychrobacter lutiphocae]|uniref:LysE family translocator n=1 Tax=Psychrobacter lutiphocae TaxID=540500 RepID=UPI0003650802|nr:LysE family transporter [Psychrobacter lutiphocae]
MVPAEIEAQVLTADAKKSGEKDSLKSVTSGCLVSLSNPKVILFYVSLLPSFFPVANLTGIDISVLCVVIFCSAMVSMMLYAFMASYAQQQLKTAKARQRFNRVGSSFMGLAGVWLLSKG